MAGKLAEVYVEVGADQRPFDRSLSSMRSKIAGLASMRFNIPGGGLLAALGLGAAGAGVGKAIMGASDLSETISKVGAVFGAQSVEVTKAADEMAKSFGIPKREFLDAASQFGLIATGMGKTQAQAAAMSVKFAKLAVDASSFYNVPVDVALEKIRAGLTGESEPLKAFGVIMDEESTKLQAVTMKLAKKGEALSNSTKLAARAALIEKGLATATGDMERTAGGAANQIRKFWGSLQNLGDTVGAQLLPSFTKFIGLLNEVATDIGKGATAGGGAWQWFGEVFGQVMDFAGTVYRNWGDIVERTGIMIGGYMQNVREVFDFVIGHLEAQAKNFAVAWFNAGASVLKTMQSIQGWVASGFSGPIPILFDPVLKNFHFQGAPLALSGVADQLAEVDKRVRDREAARIAAAPKPPGAAPGPAGPGNAAPAKVDKHGVVDIDTFAKELTQGALSGTGGITQLQLDEARAQTKLLEKIAARKDAERQVMAAIWGG